MSIITKIRQHRELRELKDAARTNPDPATIGALAERYIAQGRIDDAHRIAEEGVTRFPASERLHAVRTFAKKYRLNTEIQGLRREINERPTPSSYARLADIYRELGNQDQSLAICEQCIEHFPLNENPYLIIGEIRLNRFLRDCIAIDGLEAEKQLRRVAKLNGQNVKAHLLLTLFYYCIGDVGSVAESLEEAIRLTPESSELEKFRKELAAHPGSFAEERFEIPVNLEDEWIPPEEELTVADRIRLVERNGLFANRPELCPAHRLLPGATGGPAARLDVDNLKRNLREIGSRPGVTNAVLIDRDGEPLADCSETEGLTRNQFSELVREILTTSEDTTRRMDVGSFHWCTVEGAFGGLTIAKVKSISLAVKYGHSIRAERAHEMLEEFAARNFTATPEVASA